MLTDTALKALKPREKPYKRADSRGLYVIVRPNGAIWWRFNYRYHGREKTLSMGTYPDTSLKLAREKRDDARKLLAANIDPSVDRQLQKAKLAEDFESVAREWLGQAKNLKRDTVAQLRRRLETYVYPHLGRYPIATITPADLLGVLRRIESKGNHETAHRVRSLVGRVFRFAVATGRAQHDISADLRGALVSVKAKHFAAITDPKRVGQMLRAIDGYQGQPAVIYALRLAPLIFLRPGELRALRWEWVDLDKSEIRLPGEVMKMGRDHIVPLSDQAVEILKELQQHTGQGELLFPSMRHKDRQLSENTLNSALRTLGYSKEEMTAHGFRSTASTLLHELGWDPLVIEAQLAHAQKNQVAAAYNRAERLKERREMMEAWADYLDGLRSE